MAEPLVSIAPVGGTGAADCVPAVGVGGVFNSLMRLLRLIASPGRRLAGRGWSSSRAPNQRAMISLGLRRPPASAAFVVAGPGSPCEMRPEYGLPEVGGPPIGGRIPSPTAGAGLTPGPWSERGPAISGPVGGGVAAMGRLKLPRSGSPSRALAGCMVPQPPESRTNPAAHRPASLRQTAAPRRVAIVVSPT